MSSLQTVAMGLVIVFLDAGAGGWDWVADPVGWILVLMGLSPVKEFLPGYAGTFAAAWVCLAVSVLTLPPDSVDTISAGLGWLFSLPTIAFSFLLCDGLVDITPGSLALRFRVLRVAYVVVGLLPLLVYAVGLGWLTVPTAVLAVVTNIALVFSVWAAGADDEDSTDGFSADRVRNRRRKGEDAHTEPERQPEREPERRRHHRRRSRAPDDQPESDQPEDDSDDSGEDSGGWLPWRRQRDSGFSADEVRRRLRKERAERQAREGRDG